MIRSTQLYFAQTIDREKITNVLIWLFLFTTLIAHSFFIKTHAKDPAVSVAERNKSTMSTIRMIPKQSEADASHSYLVSVLELALSETEQKYGKSKIELLPTSYNQKIILSLLDHHGILDVVTSAPTPEREEKFRSAQVPLMRGLLGYRMMIIRPEDKNKFSKISQESELKALKACQATHWPDADVLELAGYSVVRNDKFAQLFTMLLNKDCDYFPQGVAEGYSEVETHNASFPSQKLTAFDEIILYYPMPLLFYTSHKNFELSKRLERGLTKALQNGKFDKLMQQHPITRSLFPLTKWRNKTFFYIKNPLLPMSVPLENTSLWIQLDTSKVKKEKVNKPF